LTARQARRARAPVAPASHWQAQAVTVWAAARPGALCGRRRRRGAPRRRASRSRVARPSRCHKPHCGGIL